MIVAGAILAGGQSSRMGRTKALIEIDGQPMARRVALSLTAAGVAPVVIYGGDADELVTLELDVIADEFPATGPVGGVLGALHHFAAQQRVPDAVVIAACDLAMLSAAACQRLLDAALEASNPHQLPDVWVAATDRLEPLCALWSTRAIPRIEQAFADGERALHRVIGRCRFVEVDVDLQDLVNINIPADIPGGRSR